MQIIERAGTGFAFPSRTIYLQQADPPEIMAPPGSGKRPAVPAAPESVSRGEANGK